MKTNDSEPCPPRYTSLPLPDYRHVPGETPHPTRDPAGHSFGRRPVWADALKDLNAVAAGSCQALLYGIDLFNAGYWWECHEVLEALWLAAGIGTPAGHVLQAVIQCAASQLETRTGQLRGGRRLLDHARNHVEWAGDFNLGLDLQAMLDDTERYLDDRAPDPALLTLNFE